MSKMHQEKVWAGTESSLKAALEAEEGIATRLSAGNYPEDDKEDDKPRLLEVADGVATISIKGSLNNEEGFWNEIFGMTGYPEIREALIVAANDASVGSILLDIDSGGGAVSGVSDTANLIRLINDNVKPVSTFTDGTMASAAYWLGCAAGNVYAGRTSVVGSIGVLSTHKEYSQALKEAGVGVTVVRAGKYKALANSVEPLSADGKKQIQQVVDAAYEVFVEHVANMRGQSYAYTDDNMAQGQEFVGEAAVKAGLVDSISTFDKVIGRLKADSIDASNNFMDNRGKSRTPLTGASVNNLSGESDMSRKALTEKDIAILAAGATPAIAAVETAVVASTDTVVEPVVAPVVEAPEAAAGAPEAVADVSAVVEKPDNLAATVALLSAQLKEKDESLIQAHVKIAQIEGDLAKAQAAQSPLLEIAACSLNNMRIALNSPAIKADSMDPVQLLAEHKSFSEKFASQYKVGGIAAVSADQSVKNEPVVSDALTEARLAAVRFSKPK